MVLFYSLPPTTFHFSFESRSYTVGGWKEKRGMMWLMLHVSLALTHMCGGFLCLALALLDSARANVMYIRGIVFCFCQAPFFTEIFRKGQVFSLLAPASSSIWSAHVRVHQKLLLCLWSMTCYLKRSPSTFSHCTAAPLSQQQDCLRESAPYGIIQIEGVCYSPRNLPSCISLVK